MRGYENNDFSKLEIIKNDKFKGNKSMLKDFISIGNEIVIAIGGASSGRAHARTGDRYQDMKEMGIEPK